MRLRVLETVLIHTPVLIETWAVILSHHVYEADALQITSCLQSRSDAFISGDKRLV